MPKTGLFWIQHRMLIYILLSSFYGFIFNLTNIKCNSALAPSKGGIIFWREVRVSIWKLLHMHNLNKSFKHKLGFKCLTNIPIIKDSLKMGLSCENAINCWPNTASRWYVIALCCNVYKCVLAEISWRLAPNTLPCGAPTAHSAVFKQALKSDTRLSWGASDQGGWDLRCRSSAWVLRIKKYIQTASITMLLLY